MTKPETNKRSLPCVFLILGKAGAGKDTFADFLEEEILRSGHTVLRTSYAKALKEYAVESGWNGEKDKVGRTLLQTLGTEKRAEDEDHWVNIVKAEHSKSGKEVLLITDARYLNEVSKETWSGKDHVTIRVVRPTPSAKMTATQAEHTSENELNDFTPTFEITNHRGLSDLKVSAGKIIELVKGDLQYG